MKTFSYQGVDVRVAHKAELPYSLNLRGDCADLTQAAIDSIKPWNGYEHVVAKLRTPDCNHLPMALQVKPGAERKWAVHKGHRANRPQVSPFVSWSWLIQPDMETQQTVTVELVGEADDCMLVRAYFGKPTPPLPWQQSAANWFGGVHESVGYWNAHAFPWWTKLIRPGSRVRQAPDWFFAS